MEREKRLYQFAMEGIDLYLSEIDEKIYLVCPTSLNLPKIPLNLPTPGGYDTSTSSSTCDERGEVSLNFAQPRYRPNEATLDITITKTCEHWYYGDLGDDWRSENPTICKKILTVKKERDNIDCRLEDIL